MLRLMAVGFAVFFGLAGVAAAAPEIAPKVLKVVIAPPRDALARAIKEALHAAYVGAEKDTRAYNAAQQLYFLYGGRGFEPMWLAREGGGARLAPRAQKIVEVFKTSDLTGLRPRDYLALVRDPATAGADPKKLADVEVALLRAVARYAQDAHGGRIEPTSVSPLLTIAPKRIDAGALVKRLAVADDPAAILRDLGPKGAEFGRLKAALAKFYRTGLVVEQVRVPPGKVLKLGMQDERVPLLRTRLAVAAPEIPEGATHAAADTLFDAPLAAALARFQAENALTSDGILGPETLAALNSSSVNRDDIIANMERWRWAPDELGSFHVAVNIPEFTARIVRDGSPIHSTRIVVGTPKNQTPIFSDEIRNIVVNPYWNVPPSIAQNEIRPHIVADSDYLAGQNMELLANGRPVDPARVDWAAADINRYLIRQRPGAGNALGQVKFLFPNEHNVYLHDTPAKSLFNRAFRAYSHGCVRVQNPLEFAGALVATNPGLSRAKLEALFGPDEKWVTLEHRIPVHLTYFTLRADADGTLRSFGDVYGHHKRLIELLNAG